MTIDYEKMAGDFARHSNGPQRERLAFKPKIYTDEDFVTAQFARDWFVRNVLVRGQPGVLGGPKKSLKTNLLMALAPSVATGEPFLGKWAVPKPAVVLLLSGESGESTLQESRLRIGKAMGIDYYIPNLLIGTELPQLSSTDHVNDLANILQQHKVELLEIDPLYLCLLTGTDPADASNLFAMGPLFQRIARACLDVGTTPILAPHTKKARSKDEPIELDDLSFAGIAEFSRQWVLVNRMSPYRGDGKHELHLSIGGSAGQSFFGRVDVDEGTLGDDFTGRKWDVTVTSGGEATQQKKSDKEEAKRREADDDENAVMRTIDDITRANSGFATQTRIRNGTTTAGGAKMSRDRVDAALERLIRKNLIEDFQTKVPSGGGARQTATAYRRRPDKG